MTQPSQSRKQRGEAGLLPALLAGALALLLSLQVLTFLLHSWVFMTFPYQLDYGEGPILQIALRAARGEEIYPALSGYPYVIASYMPLYYLLCALGVHLTGPSFLFGRLLSLLAALVVALGAGAVVWQKSKHRFASLLAGALVLTFPPFHVWATLMRVDMLALALSVAGFVLFQRGRRASGMALFALAVLTRRTALAAMAAAFIDLAARQGWRRAAKLLAVQLALIAALVAAALLLTRGGLYRQLSWHTSGSLGKSWTWGQVWVIMSVALRQWPVYLALSLLAALWSLLAGPRRVLPLYFALAIAVALTMGRIGSSFNYLLEPLAVGAMMIGLLWADLAHRLAPRPSRLRSPWGRTAFLVLAGALLLQIVWTRLHFEYNISLLRPQASPSASQYVIDAIAAAPGPVLCEDVGLIELAGKETPLQPFEFTQMSRAGVLDPKPVFRDVRRGRFPLVVLRFNPEEGPHQPGADWAAGRWPDGIIAPLRKHYRLERQFTPYWLYVPRAYSASPSREQPSS
jgi:hypothetical protein